MLHGTTRCPGESPGMAERRRLPVRLTEEAHAGLDALATRHGVTRTAMLEALGLLGALNKPVDWEQVIRRARQIDRERRSRR